jgi:hypothetical protein
MPKPPWFDVLGDRYREIPAGRVVTDSDVPPADIVVATWWQTAEWVARFAPDKGEKFYLLQDYEIFSEKDAPHVVATYSLPMRKLAVSNWIRSTIADRHGIEGIELLPNAVDANHFDAPPRAKRHGGLQVGFLYSPAARKNIALAVAAVVRAREMVQGLRVCAFGCSPPAGTLPLPRWIDFHLDPP